MTGIQGGNFWQGAASGALASVASSLWSGGPMAKGGSWGGVGGGFAQSGAGQITFGTIFGGAGAALSGGNFWEGAATGFVVSALNHAAHSKKIKPKKATILIEVLSNPEGFNINTYMSELKDRLIADGFTIGLEIKKYSFWESVKATFRSSPTAYVVIRSFSRGDFPNTNTGGFARLDSNKAVIYKGLSPYHKNRTVPVSRYVAATIHELGHAIFSFNHSNSGIMFYQLRQNAQFNTKQKNIIKNSRWGN